MCLVNVQELVNIVRKCTMFVIQIVLKNAIDTNKRFEISAALHPFCWILLYFLIFSRNVLLFPNIPEPLHNGFLDLNNTYRNSKVEFSLILTLKKLCLHSCNKHKVIALFVHPITRWKSVSAHLVINDFF